MTDDDAFTAFIGRIRAGDEDAARELVRRFERAIRCEVRLHLTDATLYRYFDSMDICQSVLASFFSRAALGQYTLDKPDDLARLLLGMARKKVAFQARKQRAQRRDYRRLQAGDVDGLEATPANPSEVVADRELVREVYQRLSPEERRLADLRGDGWKWDEIAGQLGGTAKGRQMQLHRAIRRVSDELGLAAGSPHA
jgi:RNA polymerase sigma factor (sigma-70 family)